MTKFERDEHRSKRQSTLTQIDFTKLLTPIDLSENDVRENEEPYEADSRYGQQHSTGHETDKEP